MELVKKYNKKGFTTVRGLAQMFGISYTGMRRVLDNNKISTDMEVKRGTKTYYLFDKEKVLQLLAGVGYLPESEQMSEQMIDR